MRESYLPLNLFLSFLSYGLVKSCSLIGQLLVLNYLYWSKFTPTIFSFPSILTPQVRLLRQKNRQNGVKLSFFNVSIPLIIHSLTCFNNKRSFLWTVESFGEPYLLFNRTKATEEDDVRLCFLFHSFKNNCLIPFWWYPNHQILTKLCRSRPHWPLSVQAACHPTALR